jgi:hypothetical protein
MFADSLLNLVETAFAASLVKHGLSSTCWTSKSLSNDISSYSIGLYLAELNLLAGFKVSK